MTKKDGKVVDSCKKIKNGDSIEVNFRDGKIDAKVIWKIILKRLYQSYLLFI